MGRVLVVDPCPDVRESMACLVGLWSHEIETAATAREALDLVARFRPDVVTTCIRIPDMDGLLLAQRNRAEHGARTFILCVTGYSASDLGRRAREAGCDAAMTKPVDPDALERVIAGACARGGA